MMAKTAVTSLPNWICIDRYLTEPLSTCSAGTESAIDKPHAEHENSRADNLVSKPNIRV